MRLKTILQIGAIFLTLAFGPQENREFWFGDSPELQYGEELIASTTDQSLYVGRNSSSEPVSLEGGLERELVTQDPRTGLLHASTDVFTVDGQRVAMIRRETGPADTSRFRLGDSAPALPGRLSIRTQAETQGVFLWMLGIGVLAAVLAYLVNDFAWSSGIEPARVLPRRERS